MPSWSVHLAIAKKANTKLKLNEDLFLYGNLIPDVDKGTKITRYEAHYYNENLPFPTVPQEKMIDINKFLNVYKDALNNPLILGYYSHLLTDQFYNEKIYTTKWIQDENNNIIGIKFNNKILKIGKEDTKKLKRKYKHKDFELYGKYLFNDGYVFIPKNNGADKVDTEVRIRIRAFAVGSAPLRSALCMRPQANPQADRDFPSPDGAGKPPLRRSSRTSA